MIDPVEALAFSIQASPGVYAILLGSGISRAARIPTGWEIALDLVRKLAKLQGEECDPDPQKWYLEKHGKASDYSDLLDSLTKTQSERQQLLRPYWEPTAEERDEGAKEPTAAHRAIAALIAQGSIRVIITTNFDRLMERALGDAGIVPTTISSPDQIHGMLPLIHTKCCILKVHGDYQDTRIRNTPAELADYPIELNQLLDKVFDEFGLIVCGWSASWDTALRNAIYRIQSRRFTTYWATHGETTDEAQRLIEHRNAQVIKIKDADTFFQSIQHHVESLEEFAKPHPLSVESAVVSLKRYVSEPRYHIKLADLITDTVERAVEQTTTQKLTMQNIQNPTDELVRKYMGIFDSAFAILLAMGINGGVWVEKEHYEYWLRGLVRLSSINNIRSGPTVWIELQRYPGMLLFYALGVGALEYKRLDFVSYLFNSSIYNIDKGGNISAVQLLPAGAQEVLSNTGIVKSRAPLSDWIYTELRKYTKNLIPDEATSILAFDQLEILMALGSAFHAKEAPTWYRAPMGGFGYRYQNGDRILKDIEKSLADDKDESIYVKACIFGENSETCTQGLHAFREFASEIWRSNSFR